ncbi:unnamed protein product [Caretta caretta]
MIISQLILYQREIIPTEICMQKVVLETVSSAKWKKGILPKGNDSCQRTSYQIPSRWNLYFEATIYPQRPDGIYLKGNGKVMHRSLHHTTQLKEPVIELNAEMHFSKMLFQNPKERFLKAKPTMKIQ